MSAASSQSAESGGVMRADAAAAAGAGRWFPTPMFVRYIYTALFFVANVFAWVVRESHVTFFERQRRGGCNGDHDCLAAYGVLVISLTCFLFFLVMFLSTVCTTKLQDPRNSWHCHWWIPKILLLAACVMVSTFAPTYGIQLYGKIAPFGAGVFLFIQLISGMRLITKLNHKWCLANFETRYLEVIAVSIIAYVGSMVGIILMSLWYTGCGLNIAFIATTMMLVLLMPLIAIKTQAHGFYMEPALVGAYSVFLCFAAIRSEPETDCYKKEKGGGAWAHFKTIMGFVAELVSTAVAVFSTGQDYKCIQLRDVVESEDDVPYGYGFFHFVFAAGSMYFGMLFVGWDTHHTMEKWNVDIGWTSAWVHIVNEGLAVISFVAILLARIYGIEWLRQLLARIFGIGGGAQQQQQQSSEMQALLGHRNDDDDNDAGAPPHSPPSSQATVELDDDMIGGHDGPAVPLLHAAHQAQEIAPRGADDAASSSAGPAAAGAGRRRDDVTGGGRRGIKWMRLARSVMMYCLCFHVILICFASLYMLLLYAQQ